MADQDDRTEGGRAPDDESMRGHPIIDRPEAIRVIRREQDEIMLLLMWLVDAISGGDAGLRLDRIHLRHKVAARSRMALMERETALITLGGDDYQEPPEWDWDEILDEVKRDNEIRDLERAFNDDDDEVS